MRYFLLGFVLVVAAVVAVAGFRGSKSRKPPIEVFPDMDRQPKLRPQTAENFFSDRMSSRLKVEGTVSRGSSFETTPYTTGKVSGSTNLIATNALPITAALLDRGQERYQISCAPCHGAQGDGKGITSKYGMVAASFHDPRLVSMPDGELFQVITHGKGLMLPYAGVVPVEDRWAIISFVRVLQRSRLASVEDLPAEVRSTLK